MKTEFKLAIIGVILTSIYVEMCVSYVFFALGYTGVWLDCMFYYGSDLFTASNPYLLLIFSTRLRGYFVQFCTCGKVSHTRIAPATTRVHTVKNGDTIKEQKVGKGPTINYI